MYPSLQTKLRTSCAAPPFCFSEIRAKGTQSSVFLPSQYWLCNGVKLRMRSSVDIKMLMRLESLNSKFDLAKGILSLRVFKQERDSERGRGRQTEIFALINKFNMLKKIIKTQMPTDIIKLTFYKMLSLTNHQFDQRLVIDTKRVTLVYLYHVNRCGHHKKLSIAKLDFIQVCGLSLNFYNKTLRKFYKFSDSRKTWTSPTLQSADWPISRQYHRPQWQVRKRVSYPEVY